MRGKWAAGIAPRNFAWIIKDRLAVSERPGGYARTHRRVRRHEEILWIREQGFRRVVSLLPSPHNLHAYDELGVAWEHVPFGPHEDAGRMLGDLYPRLREWLAEGPVLLHQEELGDRVLGLVAGYLVWAGLVPFPARVISIIERISARQLGPEGRQLVSVAAALAGVTVTSDEVAMVVVMPAVPREEPAAAIPAAAKRPVTAPREPAPARDSVGAPRQASSRPAASAAKRAPAKRAPAKRAPAKRAPAKRAPAKRAPAKRAPAKKAPAKKAPVKKAPVKKAPAKRAPAKRAPAKRAPAKKAPVKRAPAKRAPAKRAPAKKPAVKGGSRVAGRTTRAARPARPARPRAAKAQRRKPR